MNFVPINVRKYCKTRTIKLKYVLHTGIRWSFEYNAYVYSKF